MSRWTLYSKVTPKDGSKHELCEYYSNIAVSSRADMERIREDVEADFKDIELEVELEWVERVVAR